jgi:hypothetical protein
MYEVVRDQNKSEKKGGCMIYFDVYININQIDTIAVQRVETNLSGVHRYLIRHPKGYEHDSIFHQYNKGYFPLMCKVVDLLKKKEYNPEKEEDIEECGERQLPTKSTMTGTLMA